MERSENFVDIHAVTLIQGENSTGDGRKVKFYFFLVVHLRTVDVLV